MGLPDRRATSSLAPGLLPRWGRMWGNRAPAAAGSGLERRAEGLGLRAAGKAILGAVVVAAGLSVPGLLAPSERRIVPVAAVDPEVEQLVRFLEWRAPTTMEPVLRRQVATAILDECRIAGLSPFLVLAVIEVESDFEPGAVSNRNARGLMQLRDVTVREIKRLEGMPEETGEPPEVAGVRVGIRYLAHMIRTQPSLDRALVAWNAGPGALRREIDGTGQIPERWMGFARKVRREERRLLRHLGPDRPEGLAATVSPRASAID